MTLKEVDGNCEICPLLEENICPGGYRCYGGAPIEPPCCSIDEDADLDTPTATELNISSTTSH